MGLTPICRGGTAAKRLVPGFLLVLLLLGMPLTAFGETAPPPDAAALAILCDTQTSTIDFTAGALANTMVSEQDNTATGGQVRLLSPLNDVFGDPVLGPGWQITEPTGGYTPVITDGILDVQERDDTNYQTSAIESGQTFSGNVVLEMRAAIYAGSQFVNIGFTSSTATAGQWAYFSTRGTGNGIFPVIYTSVRDSSMSMVNVPTNVSLGEMHDFRIVWSGSTLEFWVDGQLVDTRTGVNLTLPQRASMYKSLDSASPLPVDWVRVTPYSGPAGSFESSILDAGAAGVDWTQLTWTGDVPAGTTVAFETRSGESAAVDTTWSDWAGLSGSAVVSPAGRYLQYRANLTSSDPVTSPVLDDVTVCYTMTDVTPPQVAAVSPPDGSTGIVVGTAVTATFDEAVDPATLDAGGFTLEVQGGSPVPATVTYDSTSFTATLAPSAPLDFATVYLARLAATVADPDGNALGAEATWTFTTMPQDVEPPTVVATDPADGAEDVLATRPLTATFSEAMDPATLTGASFTLTPQGGGSPVAASVTYDAGQFAATLEPDAELAYATVYEARLTTAVTDLAGNPLAQDQVWTFTTRLVEPICAIATSTADFAAGTQSGTMVSEVNNGAAAGQVRLQAPMSDNFTDPTLGPIWNVIQPAGYTPVITDGVLDVQQRIDSTGLISSLETAQTWGPGVVLEARAKFYVGSKFVDVGLCSGTQFNSQYAWFSTAGTGDQVGQERITARLRQYDHTTVAIDTGASYGEWHIFKIVWLYGRADFYVDGVLVASHNDILMTAPLHAAFFKSNDSDSPFEIDWIRVTPYTASPGTYESPVVDSGTPGNPWAALHWLGATPAGTSIDFATRTGESATPDGSWSAWSAPHKTAVTSPPGRYGQYRAVLATDDLHNSPVIDEVEFCYDAPTDSTPPSVVATAPADGAAGVPVATAVTATFNKAVDGATLTAASFTLTPDGGSPVPATVSYDPVGFMATLAPDSLLTWDTLYHAELAVTVADTVGNPLPAAFAWSFTTAAVPDTVRPTVLATAPTDSATGVPADSLVTALFSEPLDPATVDAATFTLVRDGGIPVPATVSLDTSGTLATLQPDTLLAYETHFTAHLATAITDTTGNGLGAEYVWTFTTGAAPPDTVGPAVLATYPVGGAVGVPADTLVTVTFDEPLDPATLTAASFTLTPEGGAALPATVAYEAAGNLATLTPDTLLAAATLYTARLTVAITDTLGNPLAAAYAWSFTSAAPPDTTAPTVQTTDPLADAVGIPVGTAVSAVFAEALDPASLTTASFTLTPDGGAPVAAAVGYAPGSFTATLTPAAPLANSTLYEARLTTAVSDSAGNPLAADYAWSFTTESADLTPPLVTATDPLAGAVEVDVDAPVRATFSESIDPATLTTFSFTLQPQGGAAVPAAVSWDEVTLTATLVPAAPLDYAVTYEARLTTAITDAAGNPLAGDEVWTFTTRLVAPLCAVTTSIADFTAGQMGGVMLSERDHVPADGQIRLQAARSDLFLVPTLDPMWRITRPTNGLTPTITDGIMDGQITDGVTFYETAVDIDTTFVPGVAVETRAMIQPGSMFTSIGLVSDSKLLNQWAYFSTRGTGDDPVPVIFTSVRGADNVIVNVPTTVTLNEFHDFRVVWLGSTLEFYVDGALVDTRTGVNISLPQRFGFYKSGGSDSSLLIDWVRITPYTSTAGTFESAVQDAGAAGSPWTQLTWQGTAPAGTDVSYETRTGENPVPDGGWSAWSPVTAGTVASPPGRYAQFRAALATGDPLASPVIDSVKLCYEATGPDTTAPQVVATVPAADSTGVAVDQIVTAMFSEPLDPATVTAASFTLVPDGGSAVLATVSYDTTSFIATLAPDSLLSYGTLYTATLTTAVTDTSGNALAADYTWNFTTAAAPDTTAPTVVATVPAADSTGVAIDQPVTATFDEPLDPATVTAASFTLVPDGGSAVPATVARDSVGTTAVLTPDAPLAYATLYTATLTTAITDAAGVALAAEYVWNFTTTAAPDTTAPQVVATVPAADSTGVAIDQVVTATFERAAGPGDGDRGQLHAGA